MTEQSSECDSVQHGFLSNSEITAQEYFKVLCRPSYKPRRVKHKGAILVLVWNLLVMNVLTALQSVAGPLAIVWLVGAGLIPLFAGWLADAHIGRYKVIRCSIWIMWIASVLATASSVTAQMVDQYQSIDAYVLKGLLTIMAVGVGGCLANFIQFGMDQLHDASTTEITSFIIWYVLTVSISGIVDDIIFACLSEEYKSIEILLMCLNLSIALILLLRYNQLLIKEPVKHNPFKLVYKVIKYAIKYKRPRCRSAFTFCEDYLPSRIDFGKSKYGGPFTTEQVEDVKTVLRLIPMVLVGGSLAGGIIVANAFRDNVLNLVTEFSGSVGLESVTRSKELLEECYIEGSYTHTGYYSAALLIILHEVFFYPTFQRCSPRMESLGKVLIGVVLHITKIISLMVCEATSRNIYEQNHNATIPCLFVATQSMLKGSIDYRWIVLPDFLGSASRMMIYIGAVEFLSAQVPHFVKGMMVGLTCSTLLLSSGAWAMISIPFKKDLSAWGTGTISCGFWYGLLLILIQVCIFFFLVVLKLWYKKRRREDLLPNEHFFAERYYSAIT